MITSTDQFVAVIRSNRTLGLVFLAGVLVIGANAYLWGMANELAISRRAYRVLPTAPLVVITNMGKVLWGLSQIVLGWALWRSRRELRFRDGKRWPSIALAINCFVCSAASFLDVAVIFFPVFVLRAVVVNIAAWSTLSTAVSFPMWLRQYRVEISKE